MDYTLSETGKQTWNGRLSRQREEEARKPMWKVAEALGVAESGVSRFEAGDAGTLRPWFRKERAAKYEVEVGLAPGTLLRWLEEARAAVTPPAEWHPAFPGVTLAEARICPRLKVEGSDSTPTTLPALMERLEQLGREAKSSGARVKLRVAAARGVGRTTFVAWLRESELPDAVDLDEPADAPRGRKPRWMVLPALDPEPNVKLVGIELLPWDAEQVATLADRLAEQGHLDPVARARVTPLVERLRAAHLAVGPATVIELVAQAARSAPSGDDIVATVAAAQWELVRKAAPGLEGTDPTWIFRFWGQRRLDCAGSAWLAPTEEEAVASMRSVCARADLAPLDRSGLRARLAALGKNGKRASEVEEIERALATPGAGEVIDGMRAAGLLLEASRWLQAPDPSLAEVFAAVDLAARLAEVAADPNLTWALDPSWRTLLGRLGSIGADPTPLIGAWRGLPVWARVEGALSLLHLFATTPTAGGDLAAAVREVHAVALWGYLALPGPEGMSAVPVLPLLGGAMREIFGVFAAVSERWSAALGFLEPDALEALASRVPAEVRAAFQPRGSPLAELMKRNGDLPADRYDEIALLCFAPWQCPPHDDDSWQRWWLASSVASFCMRPLPEPAALLEAAANNGHAPARSALAGAELPQPELDGEPDGEEGSERIPLRHDPWCNLEWATRCRWVGTMGKRDVIVARIIELVTGRPTESDERPLVDAAERVGRDVVKEALERLSRPPDEFAGTWLGRSAWILERPAHASLAGRLAAGAGAGAALVGLHDALGRWLGEQVPDVEEGRFGSRRAARIHARTELDPHDVAVRISDLRRVARLGDGSEPEWLTMAAELVSELMAWEAARHEIAVALADLGNLTPLRARALSGAGWAFPERVLDHLDLGFRRAAAMALDPGPSLLRFVHHPVAQSDATTFLSALRTRGLSRSAESGVPDDGTYFPGADDVEALAHVWEPMWLRRHVAQLDALPELKDSDRGRGVHRTLAVLHWLFERRGGFRARRRDLPDGLWAWLAELVEVWTAFSPARAVLGAIDTCVRVDAARELAKRHDGAFLAGLWDADDGGDHEDTRREAQALVKDAWKSDPDLRAAVWQHARSASARYSALHAEEATAAPAPWAREEVRRRRARERERLALNPDPLQRVADALWTRGPYDAQEAERVVAEWWSGPEILDFPTRFALEERRPFSAQELFDFTARRLRVGSRVLVPQVRTLWEHLLALPVTSGRAPADAPVAELPAHTHPPDVVETIVELLRLTPQGDGALAAAWHREDHEEVCVSLTDVGWSLEAWADAQDIYAPVRRRDIHRAWLLAVAEEALDPALLAVEAVEPGFLRALLRERVARLDPERALPWIIERLGSAEPAELGGRLDWLWVRWAEVRPADAWAWMQRRCEEPGGQDVLLPLAIQAVVLVEGALPSARRWVGERVSRR